MHWKCRYLTHTTCQSQWQVCRLTSSVEEEVADFRSLSCTCVSFSSLRNTRGSFSVATFEYIEDIQNFCWIWLLFHRVKWKIFIFHEWRKTKNLYLIRSSEIKNIWNCLEAASSHGNTFLEPSFLYIFEDLRLTLIAETALCPIFYHCS